jgi:hypothetical protein
MKDDQFKIAITEILYLLSLANTDTQQVQVWADISTIALSCAIKLKKEMLKNETLSAKGNKMRNKTKYDELKEKLAKQRKLKYFFVM